MADVTVNATLQATGAFTNVMAQFGPVWVSDSVGYAFFINSGKKVQYSKTTNGGSSWGAAVSVLDTSETTNGYISFGIWFDKWTAGDSGTLIHVVGNDFNSDLFRWRTLDTNGDSLGTERTIVSIGSGQTGTLNYTLVGFVSITKSRGGNLYAFLTNNGTTKNLFYRSTDSGVNWTSRTSPYEAQDDLLQLIPSNDSDNQDIACVYFDESADQLSFKLYDDSGNSWGTETSIATGIDSGADWPDDQFMFHAAVRHSDGKAIVAFWNDEDVNTADLKCSVLTLTAAGANATALTDVISNVTEGGGTASVLIDQNTDDIYVSYLRGGTWESLVDVYWKQSTDDASTWGTETKYNTTQDDYRNVSLGTSIAKYSSGKLYAVFIDDDDDDLLGNFDLSVTIPAIPNLAQAAYRWYADGTENGSSTLAAQDTEYDADVSGGDVNLALRVRIQNTAGAAVATDDYQLQYELNDSGTFVDVGDMVEIEEDSNTPSDTDFDSIAGGTSGSGQAGQAAGQTFVPTTSFELTSVDLELRKFNSPTDNLTLSIYSGSETGSLLGTSGTLSGTTLTTSLAVYNLAFASPISLSASTTYYMVIERSGARDTTNKYLIGISASNSYASGITRKRDNNVWSDSTAFSNGADLYFRLYSGITPVLGFNSGSLTDGNATTNRLGSGSGSFVAGEISEDGLVDDHQITASNYTEYLYSLTLESDALADNDTLDFRVLRNGAVLQAYTVTPRITIEKGTGDTTISKSENITITESTSLLITELFINKSDTVTVTESVGRMVESYVNKSDTVTITENADPELVSDVSVSDTATITESVAVDIPLTVPVSDTITITENADPELVSFVNVSDSITITENAVVSIEVGGALAISVSDTITVTENADPELVSFVSVSDTATITENTSLLITELFASVSDTATITENVQRLLESYVNKSDTATITESIGRMLESYVSKSDTITITENIVREMVGRVAVSDTITLTENVSLLIPELHLSVSDNVTVSESTTVAIADAGVINISLSESITVSENTSVLIPEYLVNKSDTVTVTESVSVAIQPVDERNVNVSDNVTITENADPELVSFVTVNDGVNITEAIDPELVSFVNKSDTATITEAVSLLESISISVSDTVTITENVVSFLPHYALRVSDDITVSELRVVSVEGVVNVRKYYIDSAGNIYWVVNQDIGLVEKV